MDTTTLALAVLAIAAIGPLVACIRVKDSPLSFHLAFQVILFVAYGVKAALVIHDPRKYVTYPYAWTGPYVWTASVLVAAVGAMALSAAYVVMRDRLQFRSAPPAPSSLSSFRGAAWVMVAGSFGSYLVLCRAAGIPPLSIDFYSPYRRNLFLSVLSGNGHLQVGLLMLPVLAAPLLATGRVLMRTIVLCACIVVLGGVGNRTSLTGVLLIFALGLAPGLVRGGWRKLTPLLAGLVAMTMFLGYKIQGQSGANPIDVLKRYSLGFDGYDNLTGVLQAESNTPRHLGGTLFDDLIYAFIPRRIFPAKADFYGNALLQQEIFPAQGNVFGTRASFPVSLFGEGILSFGILGVLAFGAVAGVIAAWGNWLLGRSRAGGLTLQQTTALFLFGAAINLYRSLGMYLQLVFLSAIVCGMMIVLRAALHALSSWLSGSNDRDPQLTARLH